MKLSTYRQNSRIELLANDRAMIAPTQRFGGEVQLVTTGPDQHTYYIVEVSRDECARVAEALGWSVPGAPPWNAQEEEEE